MQKYFLVSEPTNTTNQSSQSTQSLYQHMDNTGDTYAQITAEYVTSTHFC